jgi:hypothetical protein
VVVLAGKGEDGAGDKIMSVGVRVGSVEVVFMDMDPVLKDEVHELVVENDPRVVVGDGGSEGDDIFISTACVGVGRAIVFRGWGSGGMKVGGGRGDEEGPGFKPLVVVVEGVFDECEDGIAIDGGGNEVGRGWGGRGLLDEQFYINFKSHRGRKKEVE